MVVEQVLFSYCAVSMSVVQYTGPVPTHPVTQLQPAWVSLGIKKLCLCMHDPAASESRDAAFNKNKMW